MADRLASLGTLVASVAHEINNPITYVLGNLGELERLTAAMREAILAHRERVGGVPARHAARSAEEKIEEAGGLELLEELFSDTYDGALRIRDLVRDLLNLSRPSERSSPLNVHEILDSTLRLVNRQIAFRARLEVDYSATRGVEGDRAKLGQVFLNLITNAIDACEPPNPETQQITVRTRNAGDGIDVDVEDTGAGIAHEDEPSIFTPFFSTKEPGEGTGLGLYISRQIVTEHGGSLDFRSRSGGGTIFTVHLPGQRD